MALEITYEDVYGSTHPEAYARIQQVIIENRPGGIKKVQIEICVYTSQIAYMTGKAQIWGRIYQVEEPVKEPLAMKCAVDPDTVTISDVYDWLKTQDAYKASKDV
jgi:hypothetical protein